MRCEHCETRIEDGEPFTFRGWRFCCNCMAMVCAWLLDEGEGRAPDPEMFAYLELARPRSTH